MLLAALSPRVLRRADGSSLQTPPHAPPELAAKLRLLRPLFLRPLPQQNRHAAGHHQCSIADDSLPARCASPSVTVGPQVVVPGRRAVKPHLQPPKSSAAVAPHTVCHVLVRQMKPALSRKRRHQPAAPSPALSAPFALASPCLCLRAGFGPRNSCLSAALPEFLFWAPDSQQRAGGSSVGHRTDCMEDLLDDEHRMWASRHPRPPPASPASTLHVLHCCRRMVHTLTDFCALTTEAPSTRVIPLGLATSRAWASSEAASRPPRPSQI